MNPITDEKIKEKDIDEYFKERNISLEELEKEIGFKLSRLEKSIYIKGFQDGQIYVLKKYNEDIITALS